MVPSRASASPESQGAQGGRPLRVALIGNSNTGKSTLFNALTGLRQHVANFPGTTVERVEGTYRAPGGARVTVMDLPGCMSLTPSSPDEAIAVDALRGSIDGVARPDVIAVVVNALAPERGLFLATQVADLGLPMVVVLNQVDAAERAGIRIDIPELIHELGVVVIPTVATKGTGVDSVRRSLEHAANLTAPTLRWHAFDAPTVGDDDTARRYGWVHDLVARAVHRPPARRTWSHRVDALVLHRAVGPLIFLGIMAVVFQGIFTWAQPLMDGVSALVASAGTIVTRTLPDGPLRSLIADGVIAGVGNVVVFVPQIAMLFLFIGLLEDSGYMARAAFLMDRFMRRVGLPGKAFIPMLSGFACGVPAILATRTIEDRKDRLATIMVLPLISCSARLPIYALLIAAAIPATRVGGVFELRGLTLLGLYLLGTIAAFTVAALFRKVLLRAPVRPFLIELPAYHLPRPRALLMSVWHRTSEFIRRAGTVILAFSVVLWALASYPRYQTSPSDTPAAAREQQLSQSLLGRVGHALEPAVRPLGYDWKLAISIAASFGARETFVSTMATLNGLATDDDNVTAGALADRLRASRDARTGAMSFTPLVALGLMVFYAFALMCSSTVAVTMREAGGGRAGVAWAALQFAYMLALAYGSAWLVYRAGLALGFA